MRKGFPRQPLESWTHLRSHPPPPRGPGRAAGGGGRAARGADVRAGEGIHRRRRKKGWRFVACTGSPWSKSPVQEHGLNISAAPPAPPRAAPPRPAPPTHGGGGAMMWYELLVLPPKGNFRIPYECSQREVSFPCMISRSRAPPPLESQSAPCPTRHAASLPPTSCRTAAQRPRPCAGPGYVRFGRPPAPSPGAALDDGSGSPQLEEALRGLVHNLARAVDLGGSGYSSIYFPAAAENRDISTVVGEQGMPAPRPRHARATPAPLIPNRSLWPAPRPRHARATFLFSEGNSTWPRGTTTALWLYRAAT
eukprot:gene24967-biopygen2960